LIGKLDISTAATLGSAPPDEDRLVNYAKVFSASSKEPVEQGLDRGQEARQKARRRRRYDLLHTLWTVSSHRRLRGCCRARIDKEMPIRLHVSGEGYGYLSNVQRCSYAGSCPVCGGKIAQKRSEEIETAVHTQLERGGGVELFMLTLPHHVGMRLGKLLKVIAGGFARVIGGRAWSKDRERFGVIGQIKTLEATYGLNGWHPHLHVLVFTARPLTDAERDVFQAGIYGRWAGFVERSGLPLPGRELCRLQAIKSDEGLSDYLTKLAGFVDDLGVERRVGFEMTRHDLKEGRRGVGRSKQSRTPFQILADFAETGDDTDLQLWHEWEQGIKGKQLVRWSNGLKALMGVTEKTDEELVEEEEGGGVVCDLSGADWAEVCKRPGGFADILEIVESGGGADDVEAYVSRIRAGRSP